MLVKRRYRETYATLTRGGSSTERRTLKQSFLVALPAASLNFHRIRGRRVPGYIETAPPARGGGRGCSSRPRMPGTGIRSRLRGAVNGTALSVGKRRGTAPDRAGVYIDHRQSLPWHEVSSTVPRNLRCGTSVPIVVVVISPRWGVGAPWHRVPHRVVAQGMGLFWLRLGQPFLRRVTCRCAPDFSAHFIHRVDPW